MKAIITSVFFALLLLLASCKGEKTIEPVRKSITEAVYASGFVAAREEYKVFALADGAITAKYHEAGDSVKAGEALFQIQSNAQSAKSQANEAILQQARLNAADNSPILQDLQIKITNAETQLRTDESNFNRYKNMFEGGAISKSEFDRVKTIFEISKNNVQAAREAYKRTRDQLKIDISNATAQQAASSQDLANYQLRSLINGVVYDTYKENGESVRRNDVMALVGAADGKYLQLSVDQQDIGRIQSGQEVLVKMDVFANRIIHARVSRIYPGMNQNDQSFRVDAVFTEPLELSFIHTSVEANIVISKKDNALVVPRNAVRNGNELVVKSTPTNKTIKIKKGLENLEEVEVAEGLSEHQTTVLPKE